MGANADEHTSDGAVHGRRLAFIFTGLLLAMFVNSLSETIAATALPTIVGDLGGVEMMQWISTAYILVSTVVMPVYGKISDLYNRKHVIMVALALYALGGRYERDFILKWLKNFYRRFFNQQFKRSCLPDGPKVGTVTLSPRGDWRMPSDAVNALWAGELEEL